MEKRADLSRWVLEGKPDVTITLKGVIASKKNSRTFRFKKGRPISLPSKSFQKWKPILIAQIEKQYKNRKPLKGGLRVQLDVFGYNETWHKLWLKGSPIPSYKGKDCDNAANTIMDLLEDAKVFVDDCQILEILIRKHPGERIGSDFGAVVSISQMARA